MSAETLFILMIDPDTLLQEMIESGLRLFNPAFVVLKAADPEAALPLLQGYKIEAVLTELEFGPPSGPTSKFSGSLVRGRALLEELGRIAPRLPVIVLTEAPLARLPAGLPVAAVLGKPPDLDGLLRRINQLVQENRESILRGISLESFLQVLEVERKTCTLTISAPGPGAEGGTRERIGRLYVHAGKLIHAETDDHEAKAAAFAMLSWPDYSIKIVEKCDAQPTITERLNAILMEWCVNKDHGLVVQ